MIAAIRPFAEGEDYRELRGGIYRFLLLKAVAVILDHDPGRDVDFRDAEGKTWLRLRGRRLTIGAGYAWDGASPKWWAFGRWWGTPDPESCRLGSLFHDCLRQFDATEHSFTGIEIDAAFWDIMRLSRFCGADTYHGAVRKLGGIYAKASRGDTGREEKSFLLPR